jgi:hypothetical protein
VASRRPGQGDLPSAPCRSLLARPGHSGGHFAPRMKKPRVSGAVVWSVGPHFARFSIASTFLTVSSSSQSVMSSIA